MQEALIIKEKDRLESLLNQKVGYGHGQIFLLRSLLILLFSEGCQTIVIGLLIPKIGEQWNLGNFQKSALITCIYLGVSLGSYLQTFSDQYGRYIFVLIDAIITSIFGSLSAICPSFELFLASRFVYGIGIGIALPLSATYITEVVPSSYRAHVLSFSRVAWSLGMLVTCLLGWVTLGSGHWRVLLFILAIPNFIALYDIIKNGQQSLRYAWVKGDTKTCKTIFDILTQGNGRQNVSLRQIQDNIKISLAQNSLVMQVQKHEMASLFNQKYCKQTIFIGFSWITICFTYYAIVLMLPSILNRNENFSNSFQYFFLVVISIVQIGSFVVAQKIMDHPSYGRKKSLYLGEFGIFCFSLIVIIIGDNYQSILLFSFIFLKIFSTGCFMLLYPYSAEIYETKIRSQAMGIFSLCGRLATTALGIVGISSLEWFNGLGLYLLIGLLSGISCILIKKMPYCTLGRDLDT